jgi:hypothetical protein
MRLVVRLLVATFAVVALAAPAGAATPAPPTSAAYDTDDCVTALPKPGCGTEPETSGDRGGAAQLALFGIMTGGLVVIGTVIVRSARRQRRAADSSAAV